MFASLADADCMIHNPLLGQDCFSTLKCLIAMGAHASGQRHDWIKMIPAPMWTAPEGYLDCGNSGTTMRLMAGLLAGRDFDSTLVGDASLSRRPMKRIIDPLRLMGAQIEGEHPPLTIRGTTLMPIRYASPIASAQVKSCVLLAGLGLEGVTHVSEPTPSRDHTERMLGALEANIKVTPAGVELAGPVVIPAFEFQVPADISSAAFWMVAAALVSGSHIMLRDVGLNPTRTGILDVFQSAGADVQCDAPRHSLGEPLGDLEVRFTGSLRAFEISGSMVPRLIDEIPVLAVLATQCEGTTIIRDAQELRVKESDRIQTVVDGLSAMGAQIEATEDGMVVTGPTPLTGITLSAGHDHRIAMSFLIAGLIADGTTTVEDAETIATSYPGFMDDLNQLASQ